MSKHTSGPWKAEQYIDESRGIDGWNVCRDSDIGESVAYAGEFPYVCIESEADARLIAAAPELLEVAKMALAGYEEDQKIMREDNCGWDGFADEMASKAKIAIIKAEGRS